MLHETLPLTLSMPYPLCPSRGKVVPMTLKASRQFSFITSGNNLSIRPTVHAPCFVPCRCDAEGFPRLASPEGAAARSAPYTHVPGARNLVVQRGREYRA